MIRRFFAAGVAAVALAFPLVFGTNPSSAAVIPSCQPVQFVETSGIYNTKGCNTVQGTWLKPPATGKEWQLVVDGGNLANGAVVFGFQIPKVTASDHGHAVSLRLAGTPPSASHPSFVPYLAWWLATQGEPHHFKWAYSLLAGTYTASQFRFWYHWAVTEGMPLP